MDSSLLKLKHHLGYINIPVLPVKRDGKMLCPIGSFSGWYFSEELKDAVLNYGALYHVKLIKSRARL